MFVPAIHRVVNEHDHGDISGTSTASMLTARARALLESDEEQQFDMDGQLDESSTIRWASAYGLDYAVPEEEAG